MYVEILGARWLLTWGDVAGAILLFGTLLLAVLALTARSGRASPRTNSRTIAKRALAPEFRGKESTYLFVEGGGTARGHDPPEDR